MNQTTRTQKNILLLLFFLIESLFFTNVFAQNPASVTFIIDIDGVLIRPRDPTIGGRPEAHDAFPPSQRITYEQVRHGVHSEANHVLVQGAPEFLLSLSRIPGSRIVFFSNEIEQNNISRLRAISLSDGRNAYDLVAPTDLFSADVANVTEEVIPWVDAWTTKDRAAANRALGTYDTELDRILYTGIFDLWQRHLEFSTEYFRVPMRIRVKHYERVPGLDLASTIIIEDQSELHRREQTEMPVMPQLRGNVLPLPGAIGRMSLAGAEESPHLVGRRNIALNQLFAARGIIDQVLAEAATQHQSIRDALRERVWAVAPRPVIIHGEEHWVRGQINDELFQSRPVYARGLRLLRQTNAGLRLNSPVERAHKNCTTVLLETLRSAVKR